MSAGTPHSRADGEHCISPHITARRAHLVAAPIEGGVVHHVLDLARFDPFGPPIVVLPPWPGLERAAARFARHDIAIERRSPAPRPGGVAEWLAGRPVDLVHVHYATSHDGTPAVEAALAAGLVVVSTDHVCAGPATDRGEDHAWAQRRQVAALQAAVLCDAAAVARSLAPRLQSTPHVVAHGIDIEHFARLPSRAAARRALDLAPATPVVGSIGALFSSKGMHRLVEAVAALRPAVLLVAGEGPERPRLSRAAARLGVDLRLLGWVDDVRSVLAAIDVFALASDSEGLPSAVLQALAAGVPVVASATAGTCEALGDTGLLVAPGDVPGLAQALAQALRGELPQRLAAGRCRVREHFDARALAARVSALHLQSLAARARPICSQRRGDDGP